MHSPQQAFFSLFEINQLIKQALAINFDQSLWVRCEIGQLKVSRGHRYISLVEKDSNSENIVARSEAVLWQGDHNRMQYKFGEFLQELLQEGMQVLLQVEVDFHVMYGLKFVIKGIDPSYTLGALSQQRDEVIRKLMSEGLMDTNKALPLPKVIRRIAVISSAEAAGYKDFIEHLYKNTEGYRFQTTLFQAAMQGEKTSADVVHCLQEINRRKHRFDVIVFIRGGGSKLDLSWFDDYRLCAALAQAPLPVLTGIGHETDQSVADMVSNTSLKTPTAAADFIVTRNRQFEDRIRDTLRLITILAAKTVSKRRQELQRQAVVLRKHSYTLLTDYKMKVRSLMQDALHRAGDSIRNRKQSLESIRSLIKLSDPQQILRKGYTLVKQDNITVTSAAALDAARPWVVMWHDAQQKVIPNLYRTESETKSSPAKLKASTKK